MAIILEETDDHLLVEEPQVYPGPYHWAQCRRCDYGTELGAVEAVRLLISVHTRAAHEKA